MAKTWSVSNKKYPGNPLGNWEAEVGGTVWVRTSEMKCLRKVEAELMLALLQVKEEIQRVEGSRNNEIRG